MIIKIRDFVGDDAEAVHAVAMKTWRVTYRDIYNSTFIEQFVNTNYAPQHLRSWATRVAESENFFAVAENDTEVIGFCNIGQTQEGVELFRIYMLPEFVR
jgi:hypothetical protein